MNRLLAVGILLVVVGMAVVFLGSASEGVASTGGFVLIGPIPIVFGTGPNGGQIAILALAAGIIMFTAFVILAWRLSALRH